MNSKVILNLAVSLDGFIADEQGGYDWIKPSGNPLMNTASCWSHEEFLANVSAVVMGKKSYDQKLHLEYTHKQVYVITSKKLQDYENIHFIGDDVPKEIMRLSQETAGDIYLFGGGASIDSILKSGMIDEYVIGVIPIILGKGIPLFLSGNPRIPLHLTHSYVEDGIVILRYIPRKVIANSFMKTVSMKMGVKENTRTFFLNAGIEAIQSMKLPPLDIATELDGMFDYIHLFAKTQMDFNEHFPKLKPYLKSNGMLWVSWPKGGRLGTDLNMKIVIKLGYDFGLVESICLSVNDTWSAIKFTHPKEGKIYNNSFGKLKL